MCTLRAHQTSPCLAHTSPASQDVRRSVRTSSVALPAESRDGEKRRSFTKFLYTQRWPKKTKGTSDDVQEDALRSRAFSQIYVERNDQKPKRTILSRPVCKRKRGPDWDLNPGPPADSIGLVNPKRGS
jgi:hypothetical protein